MTLMMSHIKDWPRTQPNAKATSVLNVTATVMAQETTIEQTQPHVSWITIFWKGGEAPHLRRVAYIIEQKNQHKYKIK